MDSLQHDEYLEEERNKHYDIAQAQFEKRIEPYMLELQANIEEIMFLAKEDDYDFTEECTDMIKEML